MGCVPNTSIYLKNKNPCRLFNKYDVLCQYNKYDVVLIIRFQITKINK